MNGPKIDELARVALDAAPTGMLMVDDEGRLLLVNQHVERIFGYSREELLRLPIEALVPERYRAGHAALRRGFLATPTSRPMGAGRDLHGLRKDGSEFPIEIGLNPVRLGDRVYVLGSVVDITERRRQQQAHEMLSARLVRAFDESPIGMALLDDQFRYTHVNPKLEEILGRSAVEILGRRPRDFTHPDDTAGDAPLVEALARGTLRSYQRTKRYVRKDGSIRHIQLDAAFIRSDGGNTQYLGQVQDVTDRFESEAVVRKLQSEIERQGQLYETMLLNMPRGAVFLVDRDMRYLSAKGPSVPDLLDGKSGDEVIGLRVEDVIPDRYKAEVLDAFRRTLAGESVGFEGVRDERTFEIRSSPIFAEEGGPSAALIHLYDVTERKAQERELALERERFRTLVERSPVGIFELRPTTGEMIFANPALLSILGLSADEIRSPELRLSVVHPDDRASLRAIQVTATEGKDYRIAFRIVHPTGIRHLTSIGAPLRDASGAVQSYIGITMDMTRDVEATAAMEQSLREKEVLLKEIHHRVKNNLQVIGSILNLRASRSTDQGVKSILEDVRGRIHAIAVLHERFYRSPNLGAIPVADYLEGICADAARAAGSMRGVEVRAVALELSIDEAVPLGLLVNELVTNAFKHGQRPGSPGSVSVTLELDGRSAAVTVSDGGPGIPDEADTKRSLGLSLVRSLARQLRGTITFARAPSRARLEFPLPEKEPP